MTKKGVNALELVPVDFRIIRDTYTMKKMRSSIARIAISRYSNTRTRN